MEVMSSGSDVTLNDVSCFSEGEQEKSLDADQRALNIHLVSLLFQTLDQMIP